jgi:hypothetical protein
VAAVVLGLALSGLTACGPTSTKTGTAHGTHRSRPSSSPTNSAAALNLLERQLQSQGSSSGYDPAGPIAVGYREGRVRWLVWTATNGGVCEGSGTLGIGPSQSECWPAKALPSGGSVGLAPLGQSSASAGRWVTLVAAHQEQLLSVTCAGTRLSVRETLSPDASTTLYEIVSDWPFHGTGMTTVQRGGGQATDSLKMGQADGRSCG